MENKKIRILILVTLLLLTGLYAEKPITTTKFATSGTADSKSSANRFEKVVRNMVKAINKGDYKRIEQDFAEVMLKAFPLKKSKPFFKSLTSSYGNIKKVASPRFVPPNQAIFPAHFEKIILDIKIVLNNQDKVIGLWFLPHKPNIPAPEKNQTKLQLPFSGRWTTLWGGDTPKLNQHHGVANQKYAFDFVIMDDQGKSYKGDGQKNEDFYCFGKKVLAPGDGVVTDVITGIRDNVPGSMNMYSALGNAVFIRHSNYEISIIAHFKQDSIQVKKGDKVKKGQILGLCGNSGNSSEAHIHYHLQNTPVIQDGTGIKCFFDNVKVTRERKTKLKKYYSPIRHDRVETQ